MKNPEFYQSSFESPYRDLVDLATDIIKFKCIGGFTNVEKKIEGKDELKEENYYYILIDENIDQLDIKSDIIAFNTYLKNNFSKYNIDNEKQDYNETLKNRTLYFKTPLDALKNLLIRWQEWNSNPEIKKIYS